MESNVLLSLTCIVVVGISAQWLAWKFRLPSILLLLLAGFIVGPFTGFLKPDSLMQNLLFPFVSLSVSIILFEGGLTLKLSELQLVGNVVRNLITVGALITWLIITLAAYFILGFDFGMGLLLGAILSVTGPTVIGPMLSLVRPSNQIASILKWEGIVIDPIGATLALLVFEGISTSHTEAVAGIIVSGVIITISVGLTVGLFGAGFLIIVFKRYWVPDSLQNPVALMTVIGIFTTANLVQDESGLLAVTIMGVALANQKWIHIKHILEFKEILRVLLLSSLFVLLAARLKLEYLTSLSWNSLIFLLILVLIARPVATLASTIKSNLSWKERGFIAWMAPRGIVAASVASVFSLRLEEQNYPRANELVTATFLVIIGTVVIYGLTSIPVATFLKVAQPNPQGVLIAGAHSWALKLAELLKSEGFRVILVDTNLNNINEAKSIGLEVYHSNILAEDFQVELDLNGIGRLLAVTSNDEVNALACQRFGAIFGRSEVYQLPAKFLKEITSHVVGSDQMGRVLFKREMTFSLFSELFRGTGSLDLIEISDLVAIDNYEAEKSAKVNVLFAVEINKGLTIITIDKVFEPKIGQKVICLVEPYAVSNTFGLDDTVAK